MVEKNKLLELETKLQYIFNDISLLKMALTHKSYAYENPNSVNKIYNERIEFLGDAILEFIISEYLYKERNLEEGVMTKDMALLAEGETKVVNTEDFIKEIRVRLDRFYN